LKRYFRIALEDDERERREKITGKVLTLDRALEDSLPYLFSLLGIGDEAAALAQMDPQIRRQRTLEAVKRVLVRETLDQPCVLIFEDLHWIDTETQAFLDLLSESSAAARLLLLVNYRPEYRHGWGSKSEYTQLRLDPLGKEESRELLTALLGEGASAEREALERLILEKTEGNPFFLEEVVQTLSEEGVLTGERGRYRLESSPGELHIPATVQGVLAARIDRLPAEEKELLQTLAVIGREFPFGLIRRVAEGGEAEIHGRLSQLQVGEFIFEQPAFPEPEYLFKHALAQEVAYHSLLGERRKALHERTGQAIEELYRGALDEHYSELAHHYGRTDNTLKAVEYLHLAGEQAVQRSAYGEGIGQLAKAADLMSTLPETRERDERDLLLQLTLGKALSVTQGFAPPEAAKAYARARHLSERVGEAPQRFRALAGMWLMHRMQAETEKAEELAEQLLQLSRDLHHPPYLMQAHEVVAETSYMRGDFCGARDHEQEAIRLFDPRQYPANEYSGGWVHLGVAALSQLSWALYALGYPDQALARSRETLALAREVSHPLSEAYAILVPGVVHFRRGEMQAAREAGETGIALASEHGFPFYLGLGTFLRASALTDLGELQRHEGIAVMRAVVDGMRATGTVTGSAGVLAPLAEALLKAGQAEEGLALIAEAKEFVTKTGECESEAELHRLKGELLLARRASDHANAEAAFREALEVARRQSAKSYELRAATSLARLWQRQGREGDARELLAPVYSWFTEGFDTRDLRDAKALLDELA
jgi:predicted ATPase